MKKILVSLLLCLSVQGVNADNEFRYAPNNAGGFIFFTYSYCVYVNTNQRVGEGLFYVYSTNSNGQRITDGCYSHRQPFYIIDWNGGGRTTIHTNNTSPINENRSRGSM